MRETRLSGSEGGARFNPLSLPLSLRFMERVDRRPGEGLVSPAKRPSFLTFVLDFDGQSLD